MMKYGAVVMILAALQSGFKPFEVINWKEAGLEINKGWGQK